MSLSERICVYEAGAYICEFVDVACVCECDKVHMYGYLFSECKSSI